MLIEDPTQNPDDPDLFFALSQTTATSLGLLVRTSSDNPAGLAELLKREIQAIDRGIPIFAFTPMKDLVEQQTAGARFTAYLMGVFGSLALALAAIGIYGVISYSVTQRRHEIGVRTALGAQRSDVFGLVIRQGLTLTGAGVGLGLAAAIGLTRLLTSQLYEISPTEPIIFVGNVGRTARGRPCCQLCAGRTGGRGSIRLFVCGTIDCKFQSHQLVPTLLGLIAGIGAAVASTSVLESLMFGVSPTDPATIAIVTALLILVALFASFIPARRALNIDPMVALRHE